MAVLDREAYMSGIQKLTGDRSDDDTLVMIEDINDTWEDYERYKAESETWKESEKKESDGVDWKQQYDDLSRRYKERFFTGREEVISDQKEDVAKDGEVLTYEDLFKEREGDYN